MNAQYSAAYPNLYRRHWWWRVREDILLQKISALLGGARGVRILDVGCGAALFFDALDPVGFVEGLESDRTAVERSGKWRTRITIGELDESYRPAAPYDLILMLDVIEHIRDPGPVLRRAAQLLAPAGRLLVTVPAFSCLWTSHDDMNDHAARYTARQLRAAFEAAGLVTLDMGYLFQSLVVPKLLVRAKERLISRRPHVPRVPPPALNRAARAWFRAEYRLAGWLPFGGSLMAVATARGATA
jgi:SAM-dependent methyltransferase